MFGIMNAITHARNSPTQTATKSSTLAFMMISIYILKEYLLSLRDSKTMQTPDVHVRTGYCKRKGTYSRSLPVMPYIPCRKTASLLYALGLLQLARLDAPVDLARDCGSFERHPAGAAPAAFKPFTTPSSDLHQSFFIATHLSSDLHQTFFIITPPSSGRRDGNT